MKQILSFSDCRSGRFRLGVCIVVLASFSSASIDAQEASGIQREADRILAGMGEYLGSAEEMRLRAEISYDEITTSGEVLEYAGTADVSLHRPDRLHVHFVGDEQERRIVLDGARALLHNISKGVFSVTDLAVEGEVAEIDSALDLLFEEYGLSIPASDLVYADPYAVLIENAEVGTVVGRHTVDGVACHHLAFRQENIDWQIWIEDGPRPIPRKLVIVYKNEPGAPRYRVRLVDWDFQPRLSNQYFDTRAPEGAAEIQFLPVGQVEGQR